MHALLYCISRSHMGLLYNHLVLKGGDRVRYYRLRKFHLSWPTLEWVILY